jgi:hemerythrin
VLDRLKPAEVRAVGQRAKRTRTGDGEVSVGVKQFDYEHAQMIGMVDGLLARIAKGTSRDEVGRSLDRLIEYTEAHFHQEERYLTEHDFPALEAHKLAHAALTQQALLVREQSGEGTRAMLALEVGCLKCWMVEHMKGTDKKYGAFLNSKGVL